MYRDTFGTRTLSPQQCIITELITDGYKNKDIAQKLNITEHVVKNVIRIIYDKTGLDNRVELAMWYLARQQETVCP